MNKNVYVHSNRSIMTISLTRLVMLVPLIIYGFYKNGIYLYRKNMISTFAMFKPLVIILGSFLIAIIINVCYELFLKKNTNTSILDAIFSSFHLEYAVILGCLMSINVKLPLYFLVLIAILILSKFIGNKVNTICLAFLCIYGISYFTGGFDFLNVYESSKTFSYAFIDYLIGRAPGGIAATHIILLVIALFGISITNNNKTTITLTSIVTYLAIMFIYSLFAHADFANIIFSNNFFFIATYVATDSVTSCYTNKGMFISGIIIALISACLYLINPIIAPVLAVLIVSIFTHLLDESIYLLSQKNNNRHLVNN